MVDYIEVAHRCELVETAVVSLLLCIYFNTKDYLYNIVVLVKISPASCDSGLLVSIYLIMRFLLIVGYSYFSLFVINLSQ